MAGIPEIGEGSYKSSQSDSGIDVKFPYKGESCEIDFGDENIHLSECSNGLVPLGYDDDSQSFPVDTESEMLRKILTGVIYPFVMLRSFLFSAKMKSREKWNGAQQRVYNHRKTLWGLACSPFYFVVNFVDKIKAVTDSSKNKVESTSRLAVDIVCAPVRLARSKIKSAKDFFNSNFHFLKSMYGLHQDVSQGGYLVLSVGKRFNLAMIRKAMKVYRSYEATNEVCREMNCYGYWPVVYWYILGEDFKNKKEDIL